MSDLEPRMRELLDAACGADEPTPEERERNRAHLGRRLALLGVSASVLAQGTSASAAALTSGGATAGAVAKVIVVWVSIGVLASGVVGGAVIAATPSRTPVSAPVLPSAPHRTAAAVSPARSSASRGVEAVGSPTPSSLIPTVAYSEATTAGGRALPAVRQADALRADPGPASVEEAARNEPGVAAQPSSPPSNTRTAPDLSLALGVLARAQQQLAGGRPAQALRTLDEYAARAPGAPMGEEREALRIVALCRLGSGRGTAEAERFLSQTASSPLSTRVRAACRL